MEKFVRLKYNEIETQKIDAFETSFAIQPLERGFANTLGNVIRRTLLSSISGVAPFAIKIVGVTHEFQTLPGVVEDVVQIILNLKTIKFVYNTEIFKDEEVLKVSLKSSKGDVRVKDLILPPGVEIVDPEHFIAKSAKAGALELELFLIAGRGFVSFETNKEFIKKISNQIDSKISTGSLIAIDSNFSPIENVSYKSIELNTSSAIIQEKLLLKIKTDGSVEAKDVLAQASIILMSHLEIISNVSNLEKDEIFKDFSIENKKVNIKPMLITSLDLSVRSYNCLRRAGYETLDDLSKLTIKEIKNIKNLGQKSVHEIIDKLSEHNVILEEGE